jgi:hypothetical protein
MDEQDGEHLDLRGQQQFLCTDLCTRRSGTHRDEGDVPSLRRPTAAHRPRSPRPPETGRDAGDVRRTAHNPEVAGSNPALYGLRRRTPARFAVGRQGCGQSIFAVHGAVMSRVMAVSRSLSYSASRMAAAVPSRPSWRHSPVRRLAKLTAAPALGDRRGGRCF